MAHRTAALLIDDDARLGALMTEYLGKHEIDVTTAGDGPRGLAALHKRRPDLAIVIDSPAFNWRVARQMHKRGIPVVYYVCPQFWAWRQGRVRLLRKYITKALVIFPFEEKIYRDAGLGAGFQLIATSSAVIVAPGPRHTNRFARTSESSSVRSPVCRQNRVHGACAASSRALSRRSRWIMRSAP